MAAMAVAAHVEADADAGMEVDDVVTIEEVQKMGIAAADIKKLKDAGLYTVKAVVMSTKRTLSNVKGLSEAKAEKIADAARRMDDSGKFKSGLQVMQQREKDVRKISTGCADLDRILGGGVETGSLTEFYGEYRTGKTQLCCMLSVMTQMPIESGGAAGKAVFIDAEGTFRPERIQALAEHINLEPTAVLENVSVARAFNHEHQMDLLIPAAALMTQDVYKLLIMDGLCTHFRTDFVGRGELSERQQTLNVMLARIKKLAEEFNVAVVITNMVQSDPGGGAMFVNDPKKPIGGHVVAHAMTTRVSLRKGKAEQRIAKVVQSPYLGEAEASFALTDHGVASYAD